MWRRSGLLALFVIVPRGTGLLCPTLFSRPVAEHLQTPLIGVDGVVSVGVLVSTFCCSFLTRWLIGRS